MIDCLLPLLVPGQPQDVRINVVNPRTVTMTWHSISPPGTMVTGYMVKWTRRGHLDDLTENSQKIIKVGSAKWAGSFNVFKQEIEIADQLLD